MTDRPHRYESCRDRDCERPYCRIWREAWAEGYDEGFADGLAAKEPQIIYVEVSSS
jgi:hypothetical protein